LHNCLQRGAIPLAQLWVRLGSASPTLRNDKRLKGHTIGDMTYKVHLDGFNLMPYLTGHVEKSPREWFLYCNDDQQLVALRYDNFKLVF
jgi:arylsulfatase